MTFLKVSIHPHECEPPIPLVPPKRAVHWQCETCKRKWILSKDKLRWEALPKEATNADGK